MCDHAGRRIPRRLHNLGLSEADLARHIAWDIGIAGVGRHLADRLDACLIMQPYSRLVIDCNRPPGSATSIAPLSDGTPVPGNENVSAQEAALREREIFAPYHRTIAKHLDAQSKCAAANDPDFAAQLHSRSMPAWRGRGTPACSITATTRWPLRCATCCARRAISSSATTSPIRWTTRPTTPSPCMASSAALPHVAIEIRQDLIGDEAGQIYWAGRLAELLPQAAAGI